MAWKQHNNKYGNKKVEVFGIRFDSTKEGRRYQELLLLQKAGVISNLKVQPKFELIPRIVANGKVVERACNYIADFSYTENGETVVEDVKGFKTDVYKMKRKLLRWRYGVRIKEV